MFSFTVLSTSRPTCDMTASIPTLCICRHFHKATEFSPTSPFSQISLLFSMTTTSKRNNQLDRVRDSPLNKCLYISSVSCPITLCHITYLRQSTQNCQVRHTIISPSSQIFKASLSGKFSEHSMYHTKLDMALI